jgi:hypothetical protein
MSSDKIFFDINGNPVIDNTVIFYDGSEKCEVKPIPGKKMKVVPLHDSCGFKTKAPTEPKWWKSFRKQKVFKGTLGTIGLTDLDTLHRLLMGEKLYKQWKKECRKERRRQMFRYKEITKRGWAVLAAIAATIFALIYFIVR